MGEQTLWCGGMEAKKEPEKKLKICCACPETRRPRDDCIVEKGEGPCWDLIIVSARLQARITFFLLCFTHFLFLVGSQQLSEKQGIYGARSGEARNLIVMC